jgi:hypothetical protein
MKTQTTTKWVVGCKLFVDELISRKWANEQAVFKRSSNGQ